MRRGFIHAKDDIKFLVLYAMQFLQFPVTFESVVDVCTWCDGGFSYFDLCEAFEEMVGTGHIARTETERGPLYAITEKGRNAAQIFEKDLPYPVRESAQASALRVVRQIRRDAAVHTGYTQLADTDYLVDLGLEDVFSIQMHVVSRTQATMLERSFRRNAEKIYQVLLESLIQERPEKEDDPKP